ncbi:MAG: zinc ribbon domain-containing protein [Nitrospinaceae bacterium]|jgi:putative FmdB family regulatory protein|nr:zinc ribbon domain-containing protein [Nitrospinaceae bacterium]MDP7147423.1 zinc ribbon domain-containing protein [Nitrospinaceae bacterium]|tara:strand:+ start:1193 stop:1627 length:435 start_codon:yes stop_codon:yes gene_type:complete
MPIYEYQCEKCDAVFETMQAISAKPLKTCNGLGCNDKDNGKVHRMVSASGFILKGSGWYTSDYPSEARKQGWESESKQAASASNESGNASGGASAGKNAPEDKASAPAPKAPAAEKTAPKSAPKKSTPRSPYSGSKKSRTKSSK